MARNASFERYGPKHYRSFSKVNKKTLFSKGHKMSMENNFDMRLTTLVRGLSRVSKKSKSTQKYGKLRRLQYVQVEQFSRGVQREIWSKMILLLNGLDFFLF